MRRNELLSESQEDFDYIMENAQVGQLGLVDINGYPRIVPLNFAIHEGNVYFHGAREGEKFELIKSNPKAGFSVDIPYSFIPSYFTSDGGYACPATQFFKSIHMRGTISGVEDPGEKAAGLQALMEKHQKEGKFEPLSHELSLYKKALTEVAVFRFVPSETTMKIKFGQNERDEVIEKIIDKLQQRNGPRDAATIAEIRKHRTEKSIAKNNGNAH